MSPDEFVKSLASWGVGGVLAGIMFLYYRRDIRSMTDFWKVQTEMLVGAVKENTASNVKLISVIDSLHRRLDANGLKRASDDLR